MINQTLCKVHRNSMHHLISSYFGGQSTRKRLIRYLLYGLFGAIIKKNRVKTLEEIFHIRLHALRLSLLLILKKYLYTSFSFSY